MVHIVYLKKIKHIFSVYAEMVSLAVVFTAPPTLASNKSSNTVKLTYSRPSKLFDVTDLNWWKTLYVSVLI